MGLLRCACYLALTGTAAFFLGRILPKRWLHAGRFPFAAYDFERGGRIYEKLHIRKWQNRVPDMSRIFPRLMPPKNLAGEYKQRLPVMIQETCVAELIHDITALAGLYCLRLWPGPGGVVVTLIDVLLLNLPFILIQRYNRPRLVKLNEKLRATEKEKTPCVC